MREIVRLRSATDADVEALGAVHVQVWRETYAGLVSDEILMGLNSTQCASMWRVALEQGLMVQLAERDGTIVGFSAAGDQPDASLPYSGIIRAIYVLRCAQRLGIGRALMATCWHGAMCPPCSGSWRRTHPRAVSMLHLVVGKSPGRTGVRRVLRRRHRVCVGRPEASDLTRMRRCARCAPPKPGRSPRRDRRER